MPMISNFSDWLNDWYFRLQLILLCCVIITTAVTGLTTIAGMISNKRQSEQLEAEKRTRLELEQSLLPRQIAVLHHEGQFNIDALKRYAGTQMIIKVLPDVEATRAATYLVGVATAAGWKLLRFERSEGLADLFSDGVSVESYTSPHAEDERSPDEAKDEESSQAAANAMVAFLESHHWQARRFPTENKDRGNVPVNCVIIRVGFKPSQYLIPLAEKDLMKWFDRFKADTFKPKTEP
jgi:hypothetical protein